MSIKLKKTVATIGICICISCSGCNKEFERFEPKGETMRVAKQTDVFDEYFGKLRKLDKLNKAEKEQLLKDIVSYIKNIENDGAQVKKALERLMTFLSESDVNKSLDENGIIYDSILNTVGRVYLKFPKAAVVVIMDAALKESFQNYALGATLVLRAIYKQENKEINDLIESSALILMQGENVPAKLNAIGLIVGIPIRKYYTLAELTTFQLLNEHANTNLGSTLAKFAKEMREAIERDKKENPDKQIEQKIPDLFNIIPKPAGK